MGILQTANVTVSFAYAKLLAFVITCRHVTQCWIDALSCLMFNVDLLYKERT